MKIEYITIHNFRSIEHETIDLKEYMTLIGPNNCGKSNVIASLLFFCDLINLKDTDYFCCPDFTAEELYVDVAFSELNQNVHETLPDCYKLTGNRFKVRRQAAKNQKPIYKGFALVGESEELYETDFFGAKGVGKGKLGDVIYIPALKNVSEELKTTGSATMAKLLKEVVGPTIGESDEYMKFSKAVAGLSERLRGEYIEDKEKIEYKTITGIEHFLNKELTPWNCRVRVDLEPLDPAKLVQQTANLSIEEEGHIHLPVENKGQGLQRSLEVALVKLWAEILRIKDKEKSESSQKKLFHPEFALLLIEEPETFQHPRQQYRFYDDLREIALGENRQVITTTHSPYFITPHADDLSTIGKVNKVKNKSSVKKLSKEFLDKIMSDEEISKFRYHLWLNPDRNAMFFSDLVILVEGQTEKVMFNWLVQDYEKIPQKQRQKCCVIDCGGKFQIDKFMHLLKDFEILHVVVHDVDDVNKHFHKEANQKIQDARNLSTKDILKIDPDIEKHLGITLPDRGSEKPLAMLEYLTNDDTRNEDGIGEFVAFLKKNIPV